jgi:hypothetical protein
MSTSIAMENRSSIKFFVRAFMLTAIITLAGCGSAIQKTQPESPVMESGFSPHLRTGTALVKRGKALFRAAPNFKLHAGDVIEASQASTTDILWPDYGQTLLAAGSVVSLSDAKEDSQSFIIKLKLESGRVWTRLQRLLGPESAFDIQAANIIASVRGTSFGVGLLPAFVQVQVKESSVALNSSQPQVQETLVTAGQDVDAPIASSTIPTPRPLTPQELQDPFLLQGDAEVPSDELNATTSEETSPHPAMQTVAAIEYQGRQIPLTELHVGTGPDCDAPHYHAKIGVVTTIDGTKIPDPESCGYGRLKDTPTINFELWQ